MLWTGNSTLTFLLGDHLGSNAITTSNTGVLRSENSEIRYMPWGTTRYTSGSSPTTYQYTGQRVEVSLGLLFYKARWYDPYLNRFIQADTIVPGGVQGLDRYAYVGNNPLKYTDPSGHTTCTDDGYCGRTSDTAYQSHIYKNAITDVYNWELDGKWNLNQLKTVYETGYKIQTYIDNIGGNGKDWINKYLGNAVFHSGKSADNFNSIFGASGTTPLTHDIYLSSGFDGTTVAHELAHVLDNNFAGGLLPATYIGGGPADAMVSGMGGNPEKCIVRWVCIGNDNASYFYNIAGNSPWPIDSYANHSGADDFAYTFAFEVTYHPENNMINGQTQWRLVWMENFLWLTAH